MSGVLRVVEEGSSRLFLITDQGPQGERAFVQRDGSLHVMDAANAWSWSVPLMADDWDIIAQGRGHWLECAGDRLARELLIVLVPP